VVRVFVWMEGTYDTRGACVCVVGTLDTRGACVRVDEGDMGCTVRTLTEAEILILDCVICDQSDNSGCVEMYLRDKRLFVRITRLFRSTHVLSRMRMSALFACEQVLSVV